ncbi:MAG: cytochrome c [Gammaproteobacteria bacterium]|nr:cytochrome c [Gammaproteobacteria bacterium]MDH3464492.1 cytochrome c [Gammaproteobacteria bacterium]
MKSITRLTLSLALFVLAGSIGAQEGPIKYRQGVMAAQGGHAGAIAQIAYGGVDHNEQLVAHIDALAALSGMIVSAFEENAFVMEDTPSSAKAVIWERWDEFQEKAGDLESAVSAFSVAVKGADADAFGGKLDGVWDACKGCHETFRKKKE